MSVYLFVCLSVCCRWSAERLGRSRPNLAYGGTHVVPGSVLVKDKVKVIWRHLVNANKTPYRGPQGPRQLRPEDGYLQLVYSYMHYITLASRISGLTFRSSLSLDDRDHSLVNANEEFRSRLKAALISRAWYETRRVRGSPECVRNILSSAGMIIHTHRANILKFIDNHSHWQSQSWGLVV